MGSPSQAPRRARPKVRSDEDFDFDGTFAAQGRKTRIEVPVARLPTGGWLHLPVVVVRGPRPGPSLWLSGAVHGDELNGVMIVDELVRRMDVKHMRGAVLAVPVVNAFGLIQGSRYLPDRRDLNRCFPGSGRGSLGSRLANLFSRLVISRCDYGIDFHSGSNGRTNLPQIRCDLDDKRSRELALTFGAPVTVHSASRDGSLRAHAAALGTPGLLYEAGEAHRLEDKAIDTGVRGALRVLRKVGILPPREGVATAPKPSGTFRSSNWVRANRSGFCRAKIKLGEPVEAGQVVAEIIDPSLGSRSSVKATKPGTAIGKLVDGLVIAGDAVIHIAYP